MNKRRWNDWMEGVGIIAIVASLIFVGLQLRQAEKIARAEAFSTMLSNEVEVGNSLRADMSIWRKGTAGAELADDEAAIFAVLVRQVNEVAYSGFMQMRELGGDAAARPSVTNFAIFLYNNPGAKSVWLAREKHLDLNRDLVNPDRRNSSGWMDLIIEDLAILESNGAPKSKASFIIW
jgi:hypothetical protein